MTPKPLTKEEFENIKLGKHWDLGGRDRDDFIGRVLAAEAFWREAVKNAPEWVDESDGMDDPECLFCNNHWNSYTEPKGIVHEPDCRWKLAQEAE